MTPGPSAAAETDADLSCDVAAARAEREWNLPSGILSAVGTIESGRTGRLGVSPWPWTVNAAGRGAHHASKGDAIASVLAIMIGGYPYIDVGCFQVDIAYHAGIFRSLDEAFDPDGNARAAALILMRERATAPDWPTAVARYHSATPYRGAAYLARVQGVLPSARTRAVVAERTAQEIDVNLDRATPGQSRLPRVIYGLPLAQMTSSSLTRQRGTRGANTN